MLNITNYIKDNNKDFYNKILKGDVFFLYFLHDNSEELPYNVLDKIKFLKLSFYLPLLLFVTYIVSLLLPP